MMTDLETAISQASLWTLEARPIIRALNLAWEALNVLEEVGMGEQFSEYLDIGGLHCAIESIRESALYSNEMRQPPQDCGEAAWDAYEAFNEALNAAVPTVDAAIRAVENEG